MNEKITFDLPHIFGLEKNWNEKLDQKYLIYIFKST